MSENPGGSCEPCKKRKCKNFLSEDEVSSYSATGDYPLANSAKDLGQLANTPRVVRGMYKWRGIPSGYINALEQRLIETESVLFCALSELKNLRGESQGDSQQQQPTLDPPPILSLLPAGARETNPNKALRVAEWKEYPLRTSEQISRWGEYFSQKDLPTRSQPKEEQPAADPSEHRPNLIRLEPHGGRPSFQSDATLHVERYAGYSHPAESPQSLPQSVPSAEASNRASDPPPLPNLGQPESNQQYLAYGAPYEVDPSQDATGDGSVRDGTWHHAENASPSGSELQPSVENTRRSQSLAARYYNTYY